MKNLLAEFKFSEANLSILLKRVQHKPRNDNFNENSAFAGRLDANIEAFFLIKALRTSFSGLRDVTFFLFRPTKLYV